MSEMTSRERFERMFEHKEADRVPMLGAPWGTTVERWRREGLPDGVDFAEYFGLDRTVGIGGDISPRYEPRVVEETEDYIVRFDAWGTTSKDWKHASSTPEWLGRTIVDRATWEAAKSRMVMGRDRVDWNHLDATRSTRCANWVPEDSRLVRTACQAVRDATGEDAALSACTGFTIAAILAEAGTPAIILGPGRISDAHTADESAAVDEIRGAARAYVALARRLLT